MLLFEAIQVVLDSAWLHPTASVSRHSWWLLIARAFAQREPFAHRLQFAMRLGALAGGSFLSGMGLRANNSLERTNGLRPFAAQLMIR